MSDIRIERCCDGCKYLGYAAHDGQPGYPGCEPMLLGPHVRCLHFKQYIPAVKEHGRVVRYLIPEACPRRAAFHGAAVMERPVSFRFAETATRQSVTAKRTPMW